MRLFVLACLCALVFSPLAFAAEPKKNDTKQPPPKSSTKSSAKTPAKPSSKTPARPAADTDPLKALGTSVELPPVTSIGKWTTLAKTTIPDNLIILFSLRGGDRVLGSGKKVELQEQAGGRSWQCLARIRDGEEPVEIGVFRLEKQALQFAWSAAAEDFPNAGNLRNAAFEIAVGTSKKVVGLRRPIKGEPLPISYDEPSTVFLDIPDPPRLDTVRIEVDMPSPEYMSRKVNWRLLGDGPALKGTSDRLFAESIRLGHLAVKIETTAGEKIKVTATPMFWLADREKPQRLTPKALATAIAQVNAYQSQLTAARDALSKSKTTSDAQKAQRDALSKELSSTRKIGDDLEALQTFVKSTRLGNIHLKVSHELEPGHMVPLLTTK